MKKTIIPALLIVSSLLKASANLSDFQLELPVYDTRTNTMNRLPVNLEKRDSFTQSTFKELIEKTCAEGAPGYYMTVFTCVGLSGLNEYAIADTNAFNRWVNGNGKVDPVTRKLIISNTNQNFMIKPIHEAGKFEIFRIPRKSSPAVLYTDKKRKRDSSIDNDTLGRIFKEIEADKARRRAREQQFLRDND